MDRKIDDGNGMTGELVFSPYAADRKAPVAGSCMDANGAWLIDEFSLFDNCGGASLL